MKQKNAKILPILLGIAVFLVPFYIVRFSVLGIPTNLFEISVLILLVTSLIANPTSWHNSKLGELSQNKVIKVIFISSVLFLASALMGAWQAGFTLEALGVVKSWVIVPMLLAIAVSCQLLAVRKEAANSGSAKASVIGASDEGSASSLAAPKGPLYSGAKSYKLKPIFYGLYASTLVVSVWAIAQKLGLVSTILYQTGDSSFSQYLGSNFRAFGPFESPNYLAMFIIPISLITIGLNFEFKIQNSKLWNKAFYFSLILPLLAVIFSGSRAGLISLVSALAVYGSIIMGRKLSGLKRDIFIIAVMIIYILFAISIYKYALRPDSDTIRFEIYQNAWQIAKENWLIGIGIGKFQEYLAAQQLTASFREYGLTYALHPHNLYLALWLNFGLLGLMSFLSVTIWSIYLLLRQKSILAYALLAALIAILTHGIFDTTYFKNDLSVIYWLIIALANYQISRCDK